MTGQGLTTRSLDVQLVASALSCWGQPGRAAPAHRDAVSHTDRVRPLATRCRIAPPVEPPAPGTADRYALEGLMRDCGGC